MKAARIATLVLVAAVIAIGFGTSSQAFHRGGVAECIGCHSMHAAQGSFLTQGSDASSTCLNCHQGSGGFRVATPSASMPAGTAPGNRTPGGDFGWLKKTYTWTVRGSFVGEAGQTHGHNVVASDYGYVADTHNTTAPGGTLASNKLSCVSCHDPHGKFRRIGGDTTYTIDTTGAPIITSGSYHNSPAPGAGEAVGVYRLLGGDGYAYDGGSFGVDAPHASVNSGYNVSEASVQNRVAYGTGMAEWCNECHANVHVTGASAHPIGDTLGSAIALNYNSYVMSGNLTGSQGTSYLSLVPYEEGHADYALLKPLALSNAATYAGPPVGGGTTEVSCLSCHRAHASGFEYALRWNPEAEFLTYASAWPGTDNGAPVQFARGRNSTEMQAAYYDRPASTFASYQRSLCNKCHAQD